MVILITVLCFIFMHLYIYYYTVDFFFEEMFIFDTSNQSNLFSFDMPFTINFIYSRTVCFSNMCTISSCSRRIMISFTYPWRMFLFMLSNEILGIILIYIKTCISCVMVCVLTSSVVAH